MEKIKSIKGINGAQLKYIAFASMFIDHFNKAIITPFLTGTGPMVIITTIFDILGRIAFPIFAFMVVEGFFKTKSRWSYLRNLLIFAVISEIPYDMFQSAEFVNTWSQNILWGLALGLFTIMVIDKLKDYIKKRPLWIFVSILIVVLSSLGSMLISSDYEYYAIIIIYLYYLFYDKRHLASGLSYLVIIKEIYAILGFATVLFYNGEKGKQNKIFNYLFYPVHLLIFGIIRMVFKI
ncbi:conjugal transfer protein TraX [Anaerococcus murdochii]|uniref:Conjugal transfer protein TraX n=1 Tax=Anaerococcus murdochii TaxID=411577 RepID=A0ABS7T023_9FIRM|nr:TraX family protein [Anaerococcus murdochii]MBZ2387115.1 conjugal transfer protein TraX [Anaerococcus murdochii]